MFDTNVYVAALREGVGGPTFERLGDAAPRTFLAAVVSAELRAGALDDVGRRAVVELVTRFERLGRVVVPTAGSWNDAGDALARLARREPSLRTKVRGLWNDALIALSARQVGATLVTENLHDFQVLRRYVRFEWQAAGGRVIAAGPAAAGTAAGAAGGGWTSAATFRRTAPAYSVPTKSDSSRNTRRVR
jgi:predicted nucleic acid-binding protein